MHALSTAGNWMHDDVGRKIRGHFSFPKVVLCQAPLPLCIQRLGNLRELLILRHAR